MKKRKAKKQLSKPWKNMKRHFEKFVDTQDAEALHQFRVQVKKIRSALTLLESGRKNNDLLKTFKPVKKIFKSAGIIRDAYLHQQQGKEHHITQPEFVQIQAQLEQKETEKLLHKSSKHLYTIQKIKKKLKDKIHTISPNDIKAFYLDYLQQTQQLLQQNTFTETLHDGRKMLKHLMYNQHTVEDSNTEKDLHLNFDYIDQLQDLLGQWHDTKLALSFFKEKLDAKELQSMEEKEARLQTQITEQAKDFEKKIVGISS